MWLEILKNLLRNYSQISTYPSYHFFKFTFFVHSSFFYFLFRYKGCVKHFFLQYNEDSGKYNFGPVIFASINEFVEYMGSKPIINYETGITPFI